MAITVTVFLVILGLNWTYSSNPDTGPVNVIVLAYHRAGSSFVGELLSAHEKASYYFEPLYYQKFVLHQDTSEDYRNAMTHLLTCDQDTLDKLRKGDMWMIRKFGTTLDVFEDAKYSPAQMQYMCTNATIHVAKTIRLRMKDAAKLLADEAIPNLKIIHLVRDPRARFNSARSKDGSWNEDEKSADVICGTMEQDLLDAETISSASYKLVRYEDVVTNATGIATDIYNNMYGTDVTPLVTEYIRDHTNAEKIPRYERQARQYYSTFRLSNFSSDHWQHDLSPETIAMLQSHPKCKFVLEKLKYAFVDV